MITKKQALINSDLHISLKIILNLFYFKKAKRWDREFHHNEVSKNVLQLIYCAIIYLVSAN